MWAVVEDFTNMCFMWLSTDAAGVKMYDMADESTPILIMGIDEAGYGPILGPLVVSAAVVNAPRRWANADWWDLLSDAVCRQGGARESRLCVADSKKLFDRKHGVGKLEKSVLALLATGAEVPANGWSLLNMVAPDALATMRRPDWYAHLENAIPIATASDSIRVASAGVRRALQAVDVQPIQFMCEVLPEAAYNEQIARTHNKATVLFSCVLRLIYRAAQQSPGLPMRIYVDRQGGRSHYGQLLMRSFQDRQLKIVDETDERSAYELRDQRGVPWQIEFRQGGETAHFLIAAASMMSKYLRELCMNSFNAYWTQRIDGLKPTAGYYQDGQRFLRDIATEVKTLGLRRDELVRAK